MLNKVTLIGNLGADPDVRYMPNGDAVATVSIATTQRWKDKATGEKREATEWHRVVLYGALAKIAGDYTKKGQQVYIEGSLKTRKWQGQDGQDRYTTEIIARELKLLGHKDNSDRSSYPYAHPSANSSPSNQQPPPPPGNYDDFDDDIPF